MGMSQQKKQFKPSLGVIVWLLLALVLLIAFFLMQDKILTTLKKTGFFTHVIGSEPAFVENYQLEEDDSSPTTLTQTASPVIIQDNSSQGSGPVVEFQDLSTIDLGSLVTVEDADSIPASTADELAALPPEPLPLPSETIIETPYGSITAEQTAGIPAEETQVKLFFVVLGKDGTVSRKEVVRCIPKTNSPLSASINSLLEGPNHDDIIENCMTLIPEGSRLLSASVKNRVATLNFSEEFEFNTYGAEGYINQLMQIVYTAASFPTVDSVQFIIEGQKKEYLGSEGVWIGTPLSVASFK